MKKVCLHDGLKSLEKSRPGVAPTGADDKTLGHPSLNFHDHREIIQNIKSLEL